MATWLAPIEGEQHRPLLAKGDEVRLRNLTAAAHQKLNGSEGTIVAYHWDDDTYQVRAEVERSRTFELKAEHLEFISRRKASARGVEMHALVPCHVDSETRMERFRLCMRSVLLQQEPNFKVFVGLSGPFRAQCAAELRRIAAMARGPGIRWYVVDGNRDRRSRFEHLGDLLHVSRDIDRDAWLLFLNTDDLWHPTRVFYFKMLAKARTLPFAAPNKLVIHEERLKDVASFPIGDFVSHAEDFDKWRGHEALEGLIEVADQDRIDEQDAVEFFDYCVPSALLQQFLDLTPPVILNSEWCDMRFLAILDEIVDCELTWLDPKQISWLMAHYKLSTDAKMEDFDAIGAGLDPHAVHQASSTAVVPTATDVAMVRDFDLVLFPKQVAILRMHVESMAIQYVGWCDERHEEARLQITSDIFDRHGSDAFGQALWRLSTDKFALDPDLAKRNANTWANYTPQSKSTPPPKQPDAAAPAPPPKQPAPAVSEEPPWAGAEGLASPRTLRSIFDT